MNTEDMAETNPW